MLFVLQRIPPDRDAIHTIDNRRPQSTVHILRWLEFDMDKQQLLWILLHEIAYLLRDTDGDSWINLKHRTLKIEEVALMWSVGLYLYAHNIELSKRHDISVLFECAVIRDNFDKL